MTAGSRFFIAREAELGLRHLRNTPGFNIAILPNGCLFSLEHNDATGRIMVNQLLGSPLLGGIMRILLRSGGEEAFVAEIMGPYARAGFGEGADRFVWRGNTKGLSHCLTLWLHPEHCLWLWSLEVTNETGREAPCDAIFVQDLGLGIRSFLMSNEAFASQYIDHFICPHSRFGPVIMSRQNLAQNGKHPWVAHGCFSGAESFATDALQLFGPAYRGAQTIDTAFGQNLPGVRLQRESACAVLQSRSATIAPGQGACWTFFGLYEPDHREISGERDLARIEAAEQAARDFASAGLAAAPPIRTVLQDALPLLCRETNCEAQEGRQRQHEEWREGRLLSFFVEDGPRNRHVVLCEKDRLVERRHGAMLRSGQDILPDEATLSATCWMHGVFASQLAIGDSSLHRLFSVSRDPYNISRTSGLRMLAEVDGAWHLLALPSSFEMGLSDCRWLYEHDGGTIIIHAAVSGQEPAMQWTITAGGAPCRFLIFGQLVFGEHEFEQAGQAGLDRSCQRISFRPDPNSLWGRAYPSAVYHFVTNTPELIEAIGGDELLFADRIARGTPYFAVRTLPAKELSFAIVGSMTSPEEAERLAKKYEGKVAAAEMLHSAHAFWSSITRNLRIEGSGRGVAAMNAIFPWLVHNAVIHLTVPHGLEQYAGSGWGTRDVCQGPVEFLLALGHVEPVKEILRRVFARQYIAQGDWPQWFMFEPYAQIEEPHSQGDTIIWPLKALCDYIESTNDLAFLSEQISWRQGARRAGAPDTVARHVDKLISRVNDCFIPGTHLPRLGAGDWNDTLQPVDLSSAQNTASSWTAALIFQQLSRYAKVLHSAGDKDRAFRLAEIADNIRKDFNRYLIRDGVAAGYAIFGRDGDTPELLLHPSDEKTGVSYSLIPMTCAITGGLFTPEQSRHHLQLIRSHLLFPDGVRLMDKPMPYHGGAERIFRRAEESSFFGREVGLMYVHAHLRYCEAMAVLGDADAVWDGLQVVNPISVTELLQHAAPRQRNCYFSSSDAAFSDRYRAIAEWHRVKEGSVPVEAGWRIYSSGPGLYISLLLSKFPGLMGRFGHKASLL